MDFITMATGSHPTKWAMMGHGFHGKLLNNRRVIMVIILLETMMLLMDA